MGGGERGRSRRKPLLLFPSVPQCNVPDPASCLAFFGITCNEDWQKVASMVCWREDSKPQVLAGFLIARGPYSWIG